MVELQLIKRENYLSFIHLLKLADDDEQAIQSYLYNGTLYSIHWNNASVGVVLLQSGANSDLEIKNIALEEAFRAKGIGKVVLQLVVDLAKSSSYKTVRVGTANCSIGNIIFYQKCGFRMKEIKRDFFAGYNPSVIENGIIGLDMIVFQMDLDKSGQVTKS
ncbi:GNAT family N-acetyltransferase [Jeotgalibacillus sp. S-D1]|uniref:GNAT family N-acetyltransferase n=1 Tax=Jeotgalibacillus sp. S-D1 TaxID=2552189 RepID=UPI00105A9D0C|nr:GNAT family N-acetyltransferase [Jeotgalibacillus sp. S-D1]TDL34951.1 GNAT family N-acetyltransferase [Jeotgalibacillus sp. S-D1]